MSENNEVSRLRKVYITDDRLRLFGVSVLSLFIEIMLIRHLGSEIRIFAYFKNLALIAAFLGLGFGYLHKQRISPLVTMACMALVAMATHPASGFTRISDYLNLSGMNTWNLHNPDIISVILGVFLLAVVFFVVIIAMIPMGQILAEIFDRSESRILDYTINIAGSLMGIWLFSLASYMRTEPVWWYFLSTLGILILLRGKTKEMAAAIGAFMALFAVLSHTAPEEWDVRWSPYQKIINRKQTILYSWNGEQKGIESYFVQVNGTFFMRILDLSQGQLLSHPGIYDLEKSKYFYYSLPYYFPKKLDEVLILGAGGGNDVAAAIRAGAKHVTAVEIDPEIIEVGKKYHPEKPYLSPKVTIVINDARNFLKYTDKKYDLIIMGVLDSHTLTSNFTNTNLDSFLYTRESIADMKARLNDEGVLALSFCIVHNWIGTKILHMMEDAFGPGIKLINYQGSGIDLMKGPDGVYFIGSNGKNLLDERLAENPVLSSMVDQTLSVRDIFGSLQARMQTDDWPYLYNREAAIPKLHLMVTFIMAVIFLIMAVYAFGAPGKSDLHFAGLGAGFLLMEVAVISRFGLFWGATWIVSSIVISLILLAILVANVSYLLIGRKAPYPLIYGAIGTLLLMVYLAPLTSGWAILLYLAPFVAIGWLFAQSFDGAATPSKALAYNLFGALVGGLSESISFVTGISSLILVGMVYYAFSAIFAGYVSASK